jgi:hypothetical protein
MRRKTGIGWIEMPQRSSLLPYRGVLSCLSKAREASGSEAARVHHAALGLTVPDSLLARADEVIE